MIYLEQAKEKYPELFEKQFCRICGKEFYYNKRQIVKKFHNLNKNKKICIGCCKQHNTKIQLLNDGNPFANKDVQKKIEKIKENKYGHKNYSNWKQAEQTNLKRYGCKCVLGNKEIRENIKNTNILRYNKEWYSQTEEWDKKRRKTNLQRYGKENYVNAEQARQTCFKHYGKYNYAQTQEYKDLWKDAEFVAKVEHKKYNTRKKNGTFSSRSKAEKRCFAKIKEIFPNAEHTYKDKERYPFQCDMYIPELDLFIECHFGWAHGDFDSGQHCPFDSTNKEHLARIEFCKKKMEELRFDKYKKNGYKEQIKVWSIDDPKKLETFKNNKLNYKIFYYEDEFNDWFENTILKK